MQIIAYLSIIPMILYATWWQWIITLLMYFVLNGLGMIMTYHRLLTHRSYPCPRWLEYTLAFITTFSLTGSAITWIAIHRKHHKFADTEKDPHSPDHLGRLRVHFLTMFAEVSPRFALDLIRNNFYMWQRKYYFYIIGSYALFLYLLDPLAVVYAWLFPAFLTIFFGTLILSTSHRDGEPHDDFILGILTWGDAFHKTHHDKPMEVRLHKYDIAGWVIETFFEKAKR